jgi:hypothetical protein
VLHLYSFDSGYSLVVLGKDCFECGGGESGSDIIKKIIPSNLAFHFFITMKLIYTLVYQSLNSYFVFVFWNMNFSHTVRNIGYFEGIYKCEISPANWKRCNICEWNGVLTQCINSLKIAIIIYRCIKHSAGMMLNNEIEHLLYATVELY